MVANTKWTHIQRDFSGGEISPRMLMRQDQDFYQKSVLEMTNYLPTPQGSAVKMPGTRFLMDIPEGKARVIPYLTPANERAIVLLTPTAVKMLVNVNEFIDGDITAADLSIGGGTITYEKPTMLNANFDFGRENWTFSHPGPFAGVNGDSPLGGYIVLAEEKAVLGPRLYKWPGQEPSTIWMKGESIIDVASDQGTIDVQGLYQSNSPNNVGAFDLYIQIEDQANPGVFFFEKEYNQNEFNVGDTLRLSERFDMPSAGFTGNLNVIITLTAKTSTEREYSGPKWSFSAVNITAKGESDLTEVDLTTPYLASELNDVQYIASPLAAKELVFVHPNHPPQELIFDTGGGAYLFREKVFTNPPAAWAAQNYPCACSSYAGRLVLAGGQADRIISGSNAATTETIWASEVGNWDTFTSAPQGNPNESLEMATIYRSPIRWIHGAKDLLVGALELEYSVSAERALQPNEIQADVQTTHGSINVQPAGFGEGLMFAADGGRKVRMLKYSDQDGGWVSPDATLLHPDITKKGIKRMVRVRSPQQMLFCVINNGDLAIYSSDEGVEGWSHYDTRGNVVDVCVLPDTDGRDVPYMLVRRKVNGTKKLYLEAIADFGEQKLWTYPHSSISFVFSAPTSVLTGLDHLEGEQVQVVDKFQFYGTQTVVGGQVTLEDSSGNLTEVTRVTIGLTNQSRLRTLPPYKNDPNAPMRFHKYVVRTLGSTRPIIAGERPADRNPGMPVGTSQFVDFLADVEVSISGTDSTQVIEISEQIPLRNEILGIIGQGRKENI